jgi:uncharacterized membrane protein HdeD (DUF308 family)
MIRSLVRNWWLLLARGIFAIVFAISIFALKPLFPAFLAREFAFATLTILFGLSALTCGLLTIAASIYPFTWSSWPLMADGVTISLVGLLVIILPSLTLGLVVYMIAIAAWLAGIFEIAIGANLRQHLKDEWLLIGGGIASFGFGSYLIIFGAHDLTSALTWVCWYAFLSGIAMTGVAIRLRGFKRQLLAPVA